MHNRDFEDKFYEATERYNKLVYQLECLISESEGVAGLHLNGEIADWEWLRDNGWLEFKYI